MDEERVRGPVCGIENCRSRIYEEGEDGYLYCQNGHRKGELLAGEDDDMYETAARTRTRKKTDQEEKEKVSKYLKGPKAVDLYLKCLQLILRHQVWFLIQEKGLPAELETVIQDLWSLRIRQLEYKITSASHGYDSSQGLSAAESGSENEIETTGLESRKKKLKETPTLIDTLALCYLGTTTLRLPVTPGDIYAWTTDGKLPYRRAIKLIPSPMKDRLPSNYHATLDPNSLLSLERFYAALTAIQVSFEWEHGILWPPLNVPLLLFRYLKELALPLEVYGATVRLGNLLEYDFALHAHDTNKLGIRDLPEAQLIACLVICVKLLFPFDGQRRYPKSTSEPAAAIVDWEEWCKIIEAAKIEEKGGRSRYTIEELTNLEERDVFSMDGNQIDQYLDFYLSNFLDETRIEPNEDSDDFQNALYEMFPVNRNSASQSNPNHDSRPMDRLETVRKVHGKIKAVPIAGEDEEDPRIRRPGQDYAIYRKEKNLPEYAKKFYVEAARVAGLSLDLLVMAVRSTEIGVERWKKRQREMQNKDA